MDIELIQENKRLANVMRKSGIYTVDDMARLLPRGYRDYREIRDINVYEDGNYGAVKAVLQHVERKQGQRTEYILMYFKQENGAEFRVMYFSKTYLYDTFYKNVNRSFVVCGKVSVHHLYGVSMNNPDICILAELFKPHIFPNYRKISGISDKSTNAMIKKACLYSEEVLEPQVMATLKLPRYDEALKMGHYPTSPEDIRGCLNRMLFNDLLYFSLSLKETRGDTKHDSPFFFYRQRETNEFIRNLPFKLTKDQAAVVKEMLTAGMTGERINALLQGDVGCGKTIVAAIIMICAWENGYQSVMMAPRGVLAKQHYDEIKTYADTLGIKTAFLTSDLKAKERKAILKEIESGEITFVIGTHACMSKDVNYDNLGLTITDEEHLFGYMQKKALVEKANTGVHSIAMSATPIPLTLANVLYADKQKILTIRTMPEGRKPVKTSIETNHANVFKKMKEEIKAGHQCFVVCPAIEDNEDTDIISIEVVEKEYKKGLPKIPIGVVHGKMKPEEMQETIDKFVSGETSVLIATTVVEVGVNIPNATVMVIEQADRFGMATLHQLRGRVGRSSFQSYCLLSTDKPGNQRLTVVESTTDGFEIADADLAQRGPGSMLKGTKQSGTNKYVSEMLAHPKFFREIDRIAEFCHENGYGKKLIELYSEHEDLASSN